jgi:hypothetical protein
MARIAIEEPCEHGEYLFCFKTVEVEQVKRARHKPPVTCPGGSHTVLTEPTDEMVERAAKALADMSNEQTGAWMEPADWEPEARAALSAVFEET